MFEKKQIIYSETQGVCQVENIVSLSASRRERKIPYYVLRPVFDKSRVYSGRKPSGKTAGIVYQGRGRGTSGNGGNEKR